MTIKGTGQITMFDQNDAIIASTQPSNPSIGTLWLDTSTNPNAFKRWDGTQWVKSTPTTASDVGAYSSTDGQNLSSTVNNIAIGGRQLVQNSSFNFGMNYWNPSGAWAVSDTTYLSNAVATINNTGSSQVDNTQLILNLLPNTQYTISFYASGSGTFTQYLVEKQANTTTNTATYTDHSYSNTLSANWTRYTRVITTQGDCSSAVLYLRAMAGCNVSVSMIKLEVGNKVTDWSPSAEDVQSQIDTNGTTISNISNNTSDDAIVGTVTASTTFINALNQKADADVVGGLVTADQLNQSQSDAQNYADQQIAGIDFTPYVTQTQLNQTTDDIDFKISKGGGVNLVKNSVGYVGVTTAWYWTYTDQTITNIDNDDLDTLGFGSGFHYSPNGVNKGISQDITVTPNVPYTLSWYLNKMTSGDSTHRFYVQIMEDTNGDGTQETVLEIDDNSATTTTGFELNSLTYTPKTSSITLRFIGYANVEAILTGVMFNLGDVALQWTMAMGEVYNTNVQMDANGIKVSNTSYDGYTIMSPEEFSGYANIDGTMTKVFTLNEDVTEVSKLQADSELTMTPIKIIPITTGGYNGWAWVKDI